MTDPAYDEEAVQVRATLRKVMLLHGSVDFEVCGGPLPVSQLTYAVSVSPILIQVRTAAHENLQ
jgi:hypothetical protein